MINRAGLTDCKVKIVKLRQLRNKKMVKERDRGAREVPPRLQKCII